MRKYRITSISPSKEDNGSWREADIVDIHNEQYSISVNLNEHAKAEASGVLMNDNRPDTGLGFWFVEEHKKPLSEWNEGDIICELP